MSNCCTVGNKFTKTVWAQLAYNTFGSKSKIKQNKKHLIF